MNRVAASRVSRRRGFTLLEVLVAIGIIMLLLAIGIISYRVLDSAAAGKATHVALATGEALVAEYAVSNGGSLTQLPGATSTFAMASPGDVNATGSGPRGVAAGNCQAVLKELMLIPKNAQMVAQLPAKGTVVGFSSPPALADGWGNPIVFVPAGGMNTTVGGKAVTVKNPVPGRPFWASAGPDGDFSAGDDNVYSFEK